MLRLSVSIPSNIAEGSEKNSILDFQIQNASVVAYFIRKTANCEPTTVNGYRLRY